MNISVVINNYNYGRFLAEAIQSVLDHSTADEVIVVDDGSTDDSVSVARRFGDRIRLVEKENGGQASAFNRGIELARGDWIYFLDADDVVLPAFQQQACRIRAAAANSVAMIHFRLRKFGRSSGVEPKMSYRLSAGECWMDVYRHEYVTSPTSGTIYSRQFLRKVHPIPEDLYRVCADAYLSCRAPFFGLIEAIDECLAGYRIHESNSYAGRGFTALGTEATLKMHEDRIALLLVEAKRRGVPVSRPMDVCSPGAIISLVNARYRGTRVDTVDLRDFTLPASLAAIMSRRSLRLRARLRIAMQLIKDRSFLRRTPV
jgi:glycosyltransferase involved in cell wall biosynthesis